MKRRQFIGALALIPGSALAQSLPPPRHGLPGMVRIGGTAALTPVVAAWARAFAETNPGIRVEHDLTGSDVAMARLYTANCDIALIGRDPTKPEIQAFEWIYRFRPRSVHVLNGSVATPGCSPALAIMVHRDNPIASLRIDQLRAAFGDEAPRARIWGDLGLTGDWAQRPVNLYAPEAESGSGRFFRAKVLGDSNRLAWARLREFSVPARPVSAEARAAVALRRTLASDLGGLAVGVAGLEAGVRLVPLATADGEPRLPDRESIVTGSYPLSRSLNACFAVPPAGGVHRETAMFLEFILSDQGQEIADGAGPYLRLMAQAATRSQQALGL